MRDAEAFLRRQSLGQRSGWTVEELIEAVAGLNAQTGRGPIVGLWTRLVDLSLAELDQGLRDYRLIKANLLRGTVHLVTRRQYLTWRLALQPMLERVVRGFCPGLWHQVDHDQLLAAGTGLLRERPGLTRAEIGDTLALSFPVRQPRWLGFAIRMLLPVVQVADESSWDSGRTRYVLAEQAIGEPLADRRWHRGCDPVLPSVVRSSYGRRRDLLVWADPARPGPGRRGRPAHR